MLQQGTNSANTKLYPFTEINPYAPWYSRIKTLWFGETAVETAARTQIAYELWQEIMPYARDNRLSVPASPLINNEWTLSPILGSINLRETFQPISTVLSGFEQATLAHLDKVTSLPSTPNTALNVLPDTIIPSWMVHPPASAEEISEYMDTLQLRLDIIRDTPVASTSRILTELEYFDLS